MNRLAELLLAIGAVLRAAKDEASRAVFADVRVELDRYDLSDLLKESTKTPAARVCFMRAKPIKNVDGSFDQDVSVAIVVVAGREGRANPDFASADLAVLRLLDRVAGAIMLDPYVGLGRISAADVGDQLVAVSEQSNDRGVAIALMEVTWRLLEVQLGRPAIQAALETGSNPFSPDRVAINDGPPEEPPLGYVPQDAQP